MTCGNSILILVSAMLCAEVALCEPAGIDATFRATNGIIELNTQTGLLRTPRSSGTGLRDCSDQFQTCLTDYHGFAFSYFRKCNDAELESYQRLKFFPKIVAALHDDLWMVFDAAPNYMFHYVSPKGIVGIYLGPPSYDFRSVLHDSAFRVASLDAMEYHLVNPASVAACTK